MTIEEFLQTHFENKIKTHGCLVLYDPDKKYKSIIHHITAYPVVDGEESTILGREKAMHLWKEPGDHPDNAKPFLIYLPIKQPVKDEEIRENPYLPFEIGGAVFPHGDEDNFQSLCRKAFPDKSEQIDHLFSHDPSPDFETINAAIESDKGWPILRSLLGSESTRETLLALLSPNPDQKQRLDNSTTWVKEFKQLALQAVGLNIKSKSKNREPLADELWRYILFSEFVLDLPEELPGALKNVPHTAGNHKQLIYNICDELRNNKLHMENYITKANQIAGELDLEEKCGYILDFGHRDTFAFEEKSFLSPLAGWIMDKKLSKADKILNDRFNSIWIKNDDFRQLLWNTAKRSLALVDEIESAAGLIKEYSNNLDSLVTGYCERLYTVDKLHREFEQVVSETYGSLSPLEDLVSRVREAYNTYAATIQEIFIGQVKQTGWPLENRLRSTRVFSELIDRHLKKRTRVAFFMVDALRYELGVELESLLNNEYQVEMHPACAQLPTTTAVGMSALLPGTDGKLALRLSDAWLKPTVDEWWLDTAENRMKYLESIYGDRFYSTWLDDFIKTGQTRIPGNINFLVIKTRDIDDLGEHIPHGSITFIPQMIKKISRAVPRLKELGFEQIIIATDHGFLFKYEDKPGDSIEKPRGDWKLEKSRCLIGKGGGNNYTISFETGFVGIKSDCPDYIVPKSSGSFYKGSIYSHEGLSLQECLLPILSISIKRAREVEEDRFSINLSYKGGTRNTITTRRPMIELSMVSTKMFHETEIQLEAYSKEKLVGDPAPCKYLNPATNLIRLEKGTIIKVPLKMEEDFEGEFEVRAISPFTQITYSTIKLKTDYME